MNVMKSLEIWWELNTPIANYKDCHAVLLPCSLLKSSGISAIISEFDAVLTALSHHEQSDLRTATETQQYETFSDVVYFVVT